MIRGTHIASIGSLLALLVGLFVPATAAAWGACTDLEGATADPFESVDFFSTTESTRMSLKVEKTAATEPDCSTVDQHDEADPAYAACYDSVDLPISTIPSLFAEHQAETASRGILGQVGAILGKSVERTVVEPKPSEASVDVSPADRLRDAWKSAAQSLPTNEAACTMDAPDSCRTAPALPSLWIPEVSTSSAAQQAWELDVEPLSNPRDQAAPSTDLATLSSRAIDVPTPPPRA